MVLYRSVFVESWNIADWTTSILLHTKAAGKHRNFKQKSTVNFPTVESYIIRQHVKIEYLMDCFS